jgi:hypothetical protein
VFLNRYKRAWSAEVGEQLLESRRRLMKELVSDEKRLKIKYKDLGVHSPKLWVDIHHMQTSADLEQVLKQLELTQPICAARLTTFCIDKVCEPVQFEITQHMAIWLLYLRHLAVSIAFLKSQPTFFQSLCGFLKLQHDEIERFRLNINAYCYDHPDEKLVCLDLIQWKVQSLGKLVLPPPIQKQMPIQKQTPICSAAGKCKYKQVSKQVCAKNVQNKSYCLQIKEWFGGCWRQFIN